MKTHLLLFTFVCFTTARAADNLTAISEAWQQSLTAESNNDYAGALESMMTFKSAGGDTYLATVRVGWLSYLNQDYDKAVQFYSAAARQEPRAITPHLGLTYTFLAQQKPKEALIAARNGLSIDQYNFRLLLIAGELLFNEGDFRKAETYFDRAHHLQPEDPIAMSWLGWSLISQRQIKPAGALFERLMQINPDGYFVRDGYAITHEPRSGGPGGRGGPPPGIR
ncbi:tetratricopeptide repeat protein [Prosthecobacter sp.]|uniref:tetratricopeptide repeat protein n=1 Tax=Prosthecobacter sp. TaxID=1965333 RepID=UPI001DF7B9FE|nr:tetratricopeptide repeat protein [Prosthecobacter sp.]MCB1279001.1 tetratricopeptide repeat protein [Prosthecobacter sp.]